MAITASAAGALEKLAIPFLVTTNDVTFTLDGSDQALAVAGTSHGGPTGVGPDLIWFERHAGTSNDAGCVPYCNVTGYDTTNDEVDYTFEVAAAGTSSETVIMRMVCVFFESNSGGIS